MHRQFQLIEPTANASEPHRLSAVSLTICCLEFELKAVVTAPIVVRPRNGSFEIYRLDASGMPVGIFGDAEFSCSSFRFEVGDVFVAYTDGITEAENRQGEQWGVRRLETLLGSCSRATSEQVIRRVLVEVSTFANGQPQRDDMTLVVMDVQQGCDL
jgi:serine phosphatase RsbU (regulator of sigma subunit)